VADARRAAFLATAVLAAAIVGLPLARLAGVALEGGLDGLVGALGTVAARTAILNTLWTSSAVAVLATTVGTVAALATERGGGDARTRDRLRVAFLAPLVMPPFVLALAWTRAFGPRGLTDQWLGLELPGLYGPLGIVLVVAVAATPLTYLVVAGALASRVEPELEHAARASGAGGWTALRTVTLPLLAPAIAAAGVVAFVFGANAFGVPAVLGTPAGFVTVTTRLYQDLAFSSDPAAFQRATALASSLVVLALVVVGSADALLAGGGRRRTASTSASATHGRAHPAAVIGAGAFLLGATILPFTALVLTALTRAVGLPPTPDNWTLANFAAAIDGRLLGGLARSLFLGMAAATLVVAIGGLASFAARGRRARPLGTAVTLGFAVPGSALAVAILIAYGGALRDTLLLILIAYVAKFWALGYRQLAGSIDRLPADLLRAARASGAGRLTTLRTVVLPILRPSLAAAWLAVFVFAIHELTMSSLLYGPGTATLAVVVLGVQQLGDPTLSAALGVLLTGLVAIAGVPMVLLRRRAASRARSAAVGAPALAGPPVAAGAAT
jgi:iron(III) transport system permease protein